MLIGLVGLGQIVGFVRLFNDPVGAGVITVLLLWNTFHLLLLISALGVLYERSQQRSFPRFEVSRDVLLKFRNADIRATMSDVSITGMGCTVPPGSIHQLTEGDTLTIDARELGASNASTLTLKVLSAASTAAGQKLGLSCIIETREQRAAVVTLMYARSENWKQFRDARANSEKMGAKIARLVRSSLSQALNHMRAVTREVRS